MANMTPTPETKPTSLTEKFARVATGMVGVALLTAAPLYGLLAGHPASLTAMAGGVGFGFFVLGTLAREPRASVKNAFKTAKGVMPGLVAGGIALALGAMVQHDVAEQVKHREEIRQPARSEEVEAVFQSTAKQLCALKNPPREVKITIAEQTRVIPCPQ